MECLLTTPLQMSDIPTAFEYFIFIFVIKALFFSKVEASIITKVFQIQFCCVCQKKSTPQNPLIIYLETEN